MAQRTKPVTRQRRSQITRRRVIDAAIEAFGMEGFERTSTRALAERAGTNLAAIHYHFGGKEALYCAAAQHIADVISEQGRTALDRAERTLQQDDASRHDLIECVCDVYNHFAALALAGGLPEGWRQFWAREQLEPSGTAAFDAIFRAIQPSFTTMFRLIARVIGQAEDDSEVRLLTTMIFGQVMVFRTSRAAALRLIGWKQFGQLERQQIRVTGRKYIYRLFDSRPAEVGNARQAESLGPDWKDPA